MLPGGPLNQYISSFVPQVAQDLSARASDYLTSGASEKDEHMLLHKSAHAVKNGQSFRFDVDFAPFESAEHYASQPPKSLWVKVKNTEPITMRAAYLAGPYVLYVDCRPDDYDISKNVFVTADQPVYEPQLLPGQSFYVELSCHQYKPHYRWTIDVISQAIFNVSVATNFEVSIAAKREWLSESNVQVVPHPFVSVSIHDTLDLWNMPVPDTSRPIHLVILTHGLHANVSSDMFFLKEQIDKRMGDENVVVKGFFGNVCKTERGVKYLGSRVAEYVVDLITENETLKGNVTKISFIGHSLGGLVQTFAVAYLEANFPWFFRKVQPINFITLASPMIGVVHENPVYIKLALLAGVVGKSGQDLGLQYTESNNKPLLLLLPTGPTHRILKRFVRRTVYANAVNDGIVPLRTSALLYLDYDGLTALGRDTKPGTTGEIPQELPDNEDSQTSALSAILSYFLPQKHRKSDAGQYNRFQTTSQENNSKEGTFGGLPKSSFVESAASMMLPPQPSLKYITNPGARDNIIMHDKVYHDSDLPPFRIDDSAEDENKSMIQKLTAKSESITKFAKTKKMERLEEEIAREYHKSMSWRKVLVELKPDAHNNIVVRRRFSNAYGWPVIQHLIANHFDVDGTTTPEPSEDESMDLSEESSALGRILSRDVIQKENEDIDRESLNEPAEHAWIKADADSESMFAVGPAGLLSDVSEMMWKLKDQWENRSVDRSIDEATALDSDPFEGKKSVMDSFM
ncbi:uncharacterized protein CXQ87_001399 [Candidozyma duobushaemuli]|uniref:DUF676 domain-containing protein n=2 Tax=Candidozyma TaxID=3303203 RepID=A0ABX8I1C2_9ASCO|nr:uncharacterized protein CXQ87_001399 [[Candida] duobushaemulonis]PVH18471.1 hypothetical protein CXQ87_001399 [[Candida] duobushaemulonis]QWU87004.1 hypothetical protein CA3LBN_001222 [[Candida] haemuloni]